MKKNVIMGLLLAAVLAVGMACNKAETVNANAGAIPPATSNTSTAQPAGATAGQPTSQPSAADKNRVSGEMATVLREYSEANTRGDKFRQRVETGRSLERPSGLFSKELTTQGKPYKTGPFVQLC